MELSWKWPRKMKNPSCTELSQKWSRFFINKGIFDFAKIQYLWCKYFTCLKLALWLAMKTYYYYYIALHHKLGLQVPPSTHCDEVESDAYHKDAHRSRRFINKRNSSHIYAIQRNGDQNLFFGGPPATVNDVIGWFKRLVTISWITACICMYLRVDSILQFSPWCPKAV